MYLDFNEDSAFLSYYHLQQQLNYLVFVCLFVVLRKEVHLDEEINMILLEMKNLFSILLLQYAISEWPFLSVSKRVLVHNLLSGIKIMKVQAKLISI